MIFTVVGLHHADSLEVLIHVVVQSIVQVERALEDRMHVSGDGDEAAAQNWDGHEEDHGDGGADAEAQDPCDDDQQRGAHAHADEHLVGVLQVRDIRGAPRDDGTGGEPVDVREAEALHLLEHVVAQVLGEACGRHCRVTTGESAGYGGDDGAHQQNRTILPHLRHGSASDATVDEQRHDRGDDHFEDGFDRHRRRREQAFFLVFAQALAQRPYDVGGLGKLAIAFFLIGRDKRHRGPCRGFAGCGVRCGWRVVNRACRVVSCAHSRAPSINLSSLL